MMRKRTAYDYKFIKLLGEGSFSSVYLAVDACPMSSEQVVKYSSLDQIKQISPQPPPQLPSLSETVTINSNKQNQANEKIIPDLNKSFLATSSIVMKARKYAIKVCQKSYIKRQNKQEAIMREKEIMNILNEHPNEHFIKLHCTFQDVDRLYFVMTYAENGELLNYMQENPLNLHSVQKYTIQLVEALEHLHKLGILHRDLKPENILLNDQMNILITDFGSAKLLKATNEDSKAPPDRRNSFVGTAQYVSPEMLKNRISTNMSDLWALGVIVYQMVTNTMPFNAPNEYLIYQKIQNLDYEFPDDFHQNARNLVSSLIKLDPSERLGATDDLKNFGYPSIRAHSFLMESFSLDDETNLNCTQDKSVDQDLVHLDKIKPGLDETQLLRLLTAS